MVVLRLVCDCFALNVCFNGLLLWCDTVGWVFWLLGVLFAGLCWISVRCGFVVSGLVARGVLRVCCFMSLLFFCLLVLMWMSLGLRFRRLMLVVCCWFVVSVGFAGTLVLRF